MVPGLPGFVALHLAGGTLGALAGEATRRGGIGPWVGTALAAGVASAALLVGYRQLAKTPYFQVVGAILERTSRRPGGAT